MINPGELLAAYVAALRDIPDLVTQMGGDAAAIQAHYDIYPTAASVAKAVYQLKSPGILVVYMGYAPGRSASTEGWVHSVSLMVKPGRTEPGDPAATHYSLLALLVDGIPASGGQKMSLRELHSGCLCMNPPRCERKSLVVDDLGTAIDYYEFKTAFPETAGA